MTQENTENKLPDISSFNDSSIEADKRYLFIGNYVHNNAGELVADNGVDDDAFLAFMDYLADSYDVDIVFDDVNCVIVEENEDFLNLIRSKHLEKFSLLGMNGDVAKQVISRKISSNAAVNGVCLAEQNNLAC